MVVATRTVPNPNLVNNIPSSQDCAITKFKTLYGSSVLFAHICVISKIITYSNFVIGTFYSYL